MYLGKNSIFCLKAFIDGWYFRDTEKDVNIEILNEFHLWLQQYYNMIDEDNRNWDELLFFVYKDEQIALVNFFILFDKFLNSD